MQTITIATEPVAVPREVLRQAPRIRGRRAAPARLRLGGSRAMEVVLSWMAIAGVITLLLDLTLTR